MKNNIKLYHGDCLDIMKEIPDNSIDMVLCDLPYGTSYALWDKRIPMKKLWLMYEKVIKQNGAMVLTANQPFSSLLVTTKIEWFRCEWIWDKHNANNFGNANRQPLKQHEHILVFGKKGTVYYPQKVKGSVNHSQGSSGRNRTADTNNIDPSKAQDNLSGIKFPKSIIYFPKHSSQCSNHPTEKPVALLEYLIKTYTKEGEIVLDNCMGSGSTGIACLNTNRKFIGIELDKNYFKIAKKRISDHERILL